MHIRLLISRPNKKSALHMLPILCPMKCYVGIISNMCADITFFFYAYKTPPFFSSLIVYTYSYHSYHLKPNTWAAIYGN